jgi:hypothetical protein
MYSQYFVKKYSNEVKYMSRISYWELWFLKIKNNPDIHEHEI